MTVAIYTRVSGQSNRQDTENQALQLREYCERQGWDYVEYTDRRSGARADRTAFQQVFEDARLKKFDLVLFWALDRFSREGVTETLNYLKVLDGYGVAWKSFMESYLDSTGMFKEAVIAILAAVAKQEQGLSPDCGGRSGRASSWEGRKSSLIGRRSKRLRLAGCRSVRSARSSALVGRLR